MFSLNKTLIALRDAIKSSKLSHRSTITFQQDQNFILLFACRAALDTALLFQLKDLPKKS